MTMPAQNSYQKLLGLTENETVRRRLRTWSILLLAAVVAALGALLLEKLHLNAFRGKRISPLHFVGAVFAVKMSLFALWPMIRKNRGLSVATAAVSTAPVVPDQLALWEEKDRRLEAAVFGANVPTLILTLDQRMIDWNPAFALVFGNAGLNRGEHVSTWFAVCDNFRRLPGRTEALYGEGVLPLADRQRVCYHSSRIGRMVFTKLMAPLLDCKTGRIVGWSVVLNVNSVTKRQDFFEALNRCINREIRGARHAASVDQIIGAWVPRQELEERLLEAMPARGRVLHLGGGTGQLSLKLAQRGLKVTLVEPQTHLLRKARERLAQVRRRVRLVRRAFFDLDVLPKERFEGGIVNLAMPYHCEPEALFQVLYASLKAGATLAVTCREGSVAADALLDAVRADLQALGAYDQIKHQFNHVLKHELDMARQLLPVGREDLRVWLLQAGFKIERDEGGFEDGHTLLIVARK